MNGKEELSIDKLEKFIEDLESYTNAEGVIHLARCKWCEELINHTVASRANNFDKYTKWEVKVNSVIREDDFIQKVWRVKRIAEGRITILTDTVRDVRRQADTLLELGRRRRNESYRHN